MMTMPSAPSRRSEGLGRAVSAGGDAMSGMASLTPDISPTASTGAVAADAGTLLDLRHWLATRFNWRPG